MTISFDRLGLCFKLFSRSFYSRSARKHLWSFVAPLKPGEIVVDLGGGAGALIELAHGRRPDLKYVCTDPAIGMLRYAPLYAWKVAGRAEQLPFKPAVSAFMIGDAIHHFKSPESAVEGMYGTLNPGGRIFIFDINRATAMGRGLVVVERLFGEPARFFSPEELRDLLTKKGFLVTSITHGFRYTIEARLNSIPSAPPGSSAPPPV